MNFDVADFENYLAELLNGLAIKASPKQLQLYAAYAAELLAWNKITNLTAITKTREIAEKHFADSLCALPYVTANAAETTVLDIGSGGGFPAIPFAIANPGLKVTAVDSVRKKMSFQEHVKAKLHLANLTVVHARVQELDKALGHAPVFDCVISRAFAALDVFVELALPWVKPNGKIITYKSHTLNAEQAVLQQKYPRLKIKSHPYSLPGASARYIVVLEALGLKT